MITIRRADGSDHEALGRHGAALMRQHHASDHRRFLQADDPEAVYGQFLASRIGEPGNLVLVAEHGHEVVGYVYAVDIPTITWIELRGPCGVVHDIYVDESARRLGAGRALMRAALDWIFSLGRTQVALGAKTDNVGARRLFASFGFRPTMVEMTLDKEDCHA